MPGTSSAGSLNFLQQLLLSLEDRLNKKGLQEATCRKFLQGVLTGVHANVGNKRGEVLVFVYLQIQE